ncbi:unnamed protein product [Ectocarpus sp. CCAP 1310/34]|nr:unnamed protein product [Ectocarpus sp. CCAP 1310/34]
MSDAVKEAHQQEEVYLSTSVPQAKAEPRVATGRPRTSGLLPGGHPSVAATCPTTMQVQAKPKLRRPEKSGRGSVNMLRNPPEMHRLESAAEHVLEQADQREATAGRGFAKLRNSSIIISSEGSSSVRRWSRAIFLERCRMQGVARKEALRKLAKHRSQLKKAAAASAACRSGWERGQNYFRAVIKECQSAVAVTSAGM